MSGTLYGVGVGPGDPDLLTVRAARLIESAKVVAYPAPDTGESFARSIVAASLTGKTEIPIVIPMRVETFPAQAVYDDAAAKIAKHLEAGEDVVVLCEGDPFFYGSFMYLHDRLKDKAPVEIVPGVSSMTACAARAGLPLSRRNDRLAVIPAPLPDEEIEALLKGAEAAVIMKIGRHFPRIRALLEKLDLISRATYVAHATLPQEKIMPLGEMTEDQAPYFSMILIAERDALWQS